MNRREGVETRRRVRVECGVYRQPNGKYAVRVTLDGRPRFRTVEGDLDAARSARARLAVAADAGLLPACPRLTFATVAARWLERFETMVAIGERRPKTSESHRYHLDRHLLPALGRRIATISVDDIAGLIRSLAGAGRAPRTIAGALATLGSILRYALRRGCSTSTRTSSTSPPRHRDPHPDGLKLVRAPARTRRRAGQQRRRDRPAASADRRRDGAPAEGPALDR
jgi:hypothetical protein